jgi:hypothetical protein
MAQALGTAPSSAHRIEICQECYKTAWTTRGGVVGNESFCDPCRDALVAEEVGGVPFAAPASEPVAETEIAIDRTVWTIDNTDLDTWTVRVDGHDAGEAIEIGRSESEFWVSLQGCDVWPDGSEISKIAADEEDAIRIIREAWEEFWAFCTSCGEPTTDADRAVLPVGVDVIGVYCASCRQV